MNNDKVTLKELIDLIKMYLMQQEIIPKIFYSEIKKNISSLIKENTTIFLSLIILIVAIWGVNINIKNNRAAEQQLKLTKEQQEWLRKEKERRADLYLVTTKIEKEPPNGVKLSFSMENRGNDIAERWQVRIFIPESYNPKAEGMLKFSLSEDLLGFKYGYYDSQEKILYYSKEDKYSAKLGCTLSFKIPLEQQEEKFIELIYRINYSRGEFERSLKIENPYVQ